MHSRSSRSRRQPGGTWLAHPSGALGAARQGAHQGARARAVRCWRPPALLLKAVAAALGAADRRIPLLPQPRGPAHRPGVDAYRDLADAVAPAVTPAPLASAYRAWARRSPTATACVRARSRYDAHSRPLVEASQLAIDELLRCLDSSGPGPVPFSTPRSSRRGRRPAAPRQPRTGQERRSRSWHACTGWPRCRSNGNFTSVGVDPGPLYADAVRSGPGGTEIP